MADNVVASPGIGGDTFAADDIGGVKYPRGKVAWGPDGTANDADIAAGMALPVQLRDTAGAEILGTTTDAASASGAAGTVSAKLRQLRDDMAAVRAAQTTLGQQLMAASVPVVVASDQTQVPVRGNLLGSTQSIPARPSNTTPYVSGQAYNINPKTITAATNASPSVVTSTAHGFINGQAVNISGVVGATGLNGNWLVANVTTDTFTLTDINGNAVNTPGVWSSGGSILLILTFPLITRVAQGRAYIVKARLALDGLTMTGTWRLYLYNDLVTPIADAQTFNLLKASNAVRVGYLDFTAVTEGAGSDCSFAELVGGSAGIPFEFRSSVGAALYGQLVAKAGATPISAGLGRIDMTAETY